MGPISLDEGGSLLDLSRNCCASYNHTLMVYVPYHQMELARCIASTKPYTLAPITLNIDDSCEEKRQIAMFYTSDDSKLRDHFYYIVPDGNERVKVVCGYGDEDTINKHRVWTRKYHAKHN